LLDALYRPRGMPVGTLKSPRALGMDERTQLILTRAKELLARDIPGASWINDVNRLDAKTIERQGGYLSIAEEQLLEEGQIESVDQS
jgi:hypothetical protein